MIETRHNYGRHDTVCDVIYDSGTISPVYLGLHNATESAEFNIDRQDLPKVIEMLTAALAANR
ncbi:hypothetical protein [Streptomyces sp. NRRL F-2580]|uniref:hypothetical protein n=1 Tax=Streptomyces sp. NRRL F-2580 TaxID=1463841 RepID=UPI0004C539DE|nr:hypothetical protein [Streptomyces sp. NRRL F-2580]